MAVVEQSAERLPGIEATAVTIAPGCKLSSTIRDFSAVDQRRRRSGLVRTVTVDIYAPANLPVSVLTSHAAEHPPRRPSPDTYAVSMVRDDAGEAGDTRLRSDAFVCGLTSAQFSTPDLSNPTREYPLECNSYTVLNRFPDIQRQAVSIT